MFVRDADTRAAEEYARAAGLKSRELVLGVLVFAVCTYVFLIAYFRDEPGAASARGLILSLVAGVIVGVATFMIQTRFTNRYTASLEERVAKQKRRKPLDLVSAAIGAGVGIFALNNGAGTGQLLFAFGLGIILIECAGMVYDRWYCLPRIIASGSAFSA